jgi:hypothetical protein
LLEALNLIFGLEGIGKDCIVFGFLPTLGFVLNFVNVPNPDILIV